MREVEEFVIHPNAFKRDLGVGQAVMLVPHDRGTKTVRVRLRRFEDLPAVPLPLVEKKVPALIALEKRPSEQPRPDAVPVDELASQKQQEVA